MHCFILLAAPTLASHIWQPPQWHLPSRGFKTACIDIFSPEERGQHLAGAALKQHDAKAVDVCLLRVVLPGQDLRGHVLQGTVSCQCLAAEIRL